MEGDISHIVCGLMFGKCSHFVLRTLEGCQWTSFRCLFSWVWASYIHLINPVVHRVPMIYIKLVLSVGFIVVLEEWSICNVSTITKRYQREAWKWYYFFVPSSKSIKLRTSVANNISIIRAVRMTLSLISMMEMFCESC